MKPADRPGGEIAGDSLAINRVLAGDTDAFARLVEGHRDAVFRLAFLMLGIRADAEDVAQEAFVKAFQALPSFKRGAPFRPWINAIALNLCRNRIRRNAILRWVPLIRRTGEGEEVALDPPEPRPGPEALAVEREEGQKARVILESMPRKYREILALRHSQGLSYQEIAQVAGLPIGTVENRLFRARRLLMKKARAIDWGG